MSGSRYSKCCCFTIGCYCDIKLVYRHRRMEAVRIRKENQIYSADDK